MLRSGEDSDVTVCVEGRDFHLHSLILRQRSPFFKVQLAPNASWREAQTGRVQIQEASQKIFGILLPFIYSHRLDWNIADWAEVSHSTPPSQPETFQDVLDLLKLAEFLQLADFAEYLLASHRKELENMLDGELKTVLPIFAGGERTGIGYREQAIADSIGAIEGFVKAALEAAPAFKELLISAWRRTPAIGPYSWPCSSLRRITDLPNCRNLRWIFSLAVASSPPHQITSTRYSRTQMSASRRRNGAERASSVRLGAPSIASFHHIYTLIRDFLMHGRRWTVSLRLVAKFDWTNFVQQQSGRALPNPHQCSLIFR